MCHVFVRFGRCAIEVKWWTKSDDGIVADCDKLSVAPMATLF